MNLRLQHSIFIFAACATMVFASGCERRSSKPNIELVQNMMESPAINYQDYDNSKEDFRASEYPPEGTIPQNFKPYPYTDPTVAEKELTNPYANRDDLLSKGERLYFINCQVCHGELGKGDGPVSSKLQLAPPSLVSTKVRNFKDGYVFHMIVMGRGLMGGYGAQIIRDEDRWAVVNYLRHMQKTQPVFPADAAPAGGK